MFLHNKFHDICNLNDADVMLYTNAPCVNSSVKTGVILELGNSEIRMQSAPPTLVHAPHDHSRGDGYRQTNNKIPR